MNFKGASTHSLVADLEEEFVRTNSYLKVRALFKVCARL